MTDVSNPNSLSASQDPLAHLLALFGAGRFSESVPLAVRVCADIPDLAAGWKILGAIRFLTGQLIEAETYTSRASYTAPNDPESHFNLGVVFERLNRPEKALEAYLRAIHIRSGYPEAYNNLGNLLRELGKRQESEKALREAIRHRPDYFKAQQNLGRCLLDIGKADAARVAYQSALCIQPEYPDAYNNLGVALRDMGLKENAANQFKRAILIDHNFTEAYSNNGIILFDQGEYSASCISYQKALLLRPDYPQALNNLGNSLRQRNDAYHAGIYFKRALRIKPDYEEAHNNCGIIDYESLNYTNSLTAYQKSLSIRPNYAEAYNNLGITYYIMGDYEPACTYLSRALAIRPDYPEAMSNLGATLRNQGRFLEARIAYQSAMELENAYAEAHWNNGLLHLLEGNYELGWLGYEWRLNNPQLNVFRNFEDKRIWRGKESISGQSILVYAEQGNGDTLQFYRYAQLLRNNGATVLLEVQPDLYEFLASQSNSIHVFPRGMPIPDHDWVTSLMSLPLAFNTTIDTIPSPGPYLRADPMVIPRWEAILGPKGKIRVGLLPSGNPGHTEDHWRSMDWESLLPLLDLPVDFFCLKKNPNEDDVRFLKRHPQIKNMSRAMIGYSDTAAIVSMMDLVITVDTSVAHLSAALGTETWILLPWIPDWRWLLDRTDSPWYQSAVLFRQDARRNWASVMASITARLKKMI